MRKVVSYLEAAASREIDLIVFPESTLNGYQYQSLSEARKYAVSISDRRISEIEKTTANFGNMYAVIGFIEADEEDLYNTAAVFGPGGYIGKYRKMHPPISGVDKFVSKGDLGYPLFQTNWGKFGVSICADEIHPEDNRVMMLSGAEYYCSSHCSPRWNRILAELHQPYQSH